MKTTKIIGMILLIVGIFSTFIGAQKISKNSAKIKALGIELDVSNEKEQNEGVVYIIGGIILLLSGAYTIGKK
ncbi:MAG: DUF3185 family protein [Flavobacterium haoranii]